MPLVPLADLAPSLACPRCHGALAGDRCDACGLAFPRAGAWPVLVDFERSILDPDEVLASAGASPIARGKRNPVKRAVLDFLFPADRIAWRNAERFRRELAPARPRILVIGGGTVGAGGVGELYHDDTVELVAFDIYGSPHTQFIADAHQIPLAAASVDGVVAQAVLEHVLEPWVVVDEIHRVLRPDGVVYAETPFLQQVHEGAYDFTRFTESGHRWLFKRFHELDAGMLSGPGAYLQWAVDHTARNVFGSRRAGVVTKSLLFWVRYVDRVARPGFDVDSASAVYFLGRKADRPLPAREMVARYKGAQTKTGR